MNVTFMVTVGILIMLVLVVSFLVITVINLKRKSQLSDEMQALKVEQQNQLIKAAVRSEETERHRIAEALHDEVGAILSSTKLHLQGIKTGSMDERDRQLYEKGKELLDEGIQKVRGISHNLHSNILKEFGLNEAIQHFISKITHNTLIKATTELDNNYTTENPENDISIYRLVQELVNNILKHSGASELQVQSVSNPTNLEIIIRHNGKGLTQENFEELRYKKDGLGLKNIQNRIILLKGQINFSSEGKYYQTKIDVPVNISTK